MIRAEASLSVIVTSYHSTGVLEKCLASLSAQTEVREIVVADCSPKNPALELSSKFPAVQFLHWDEPRIVPQLRWAALPNVSGAIVGGLEARCVPASDWAKTIVQAHHSHPECPAIGGPVAIAQPATAFDCGLYFCEYGAYAPPLAQRYTSEISGANLSYKRAELQQEQDLLDAGKWETLLHLRWQQQGKKLWMSNATICFENTMTPQTAIQQRFAYGRGYAANRFANRSPVYALVALTLPILLTWRVARNNFGGPLFRALGWLLVLNTAWALGEFTGYLFGNSKEPQIF